MTLVKQAGVSFVDITILRFLLFALMKAFQDRRALWYQRGLIRKPLRKISVILLHDVGLTDDVGSWGVKRTHSRHRGNDAIDPNRSAPGSWQRIGGESPPRGRSSQPPRPRVMHEVLLARAAVKRSQGRPRAKY